MEVLLGWVLGIDGEEAGGDQDGAGRKICEEDGLTDMRWIGFDECGAG